MKKRYLQIIIGIFTFFSLSYSNNNSNNNVNTFGIVLDEDFYKVGVKKDNLEKAKTIMDQTNRDFKRLSLERQKLEIDVNQILLEGAEKNLEKLDRVLDELGKNEASVYKTKIRSQIQMYKFVSQEEYIKARNIAIARIQEQQRRDQEQLKRKP